LSQIGADPQGFVGVVDRQSGISGTLEVVRSTRPLAGMRLRCDGSAEALAAPNWSCAGGART
jgi:hypothetical protein